MWPYRVLSVAVLLCLGQIPALGGAGCGVRGGRVVIVACEDGLGGICEGTAVGADERADVVVDEGAGAALGTGHVGLAACHRTRPSLCNTCRSSKAWGT